jgi:hypothetical protein
MYEQEKSKFLHRTIKYIDYSKSFDIQEEAEEGVDCLSKQEMLDMGLELLLKKEEQVVVRFQPARFSRYLFPPSIICS